MYKSGRKCPSPSFSFTIPSANRQRENSSSSSEFSFDKEGTQKKSVWLNPEGNEEDTCSSCALHKDTKSKGGAVHVRGILTTVGFGGSITFLYTS